MRRKVPKAKRLKKIRKKLRTVRIRRRIKTQMTQMEKPALI